MKSRLQVFASTQVCESEMNGLYHYDNPEHIIVVYDPDYSYGYSSEDELPSSFSVFHVY